MTIFVLFVSCAHQHENEIHHHHSDTSSIPLEDHGHGRFRVEHRGEVYYFDTEESFKAFEVKLKSEHKKIRCVKKAHWTAVKIVESF